MEKWKRLCRNPEEIFDPTMNNMTSADDPFSLLMGRFESCVTQNT